MYRIKEKETKEKREKDATIDDSMRSLKKKDAIDSKAQMKDDIILSLQRELTKQKEK